MTEQTSNDEDEKRVGRDVYRKMLRVIQHNTGGKCLPVCDTTIIPADSVAISMAVSNDHIVTWEDDGRWTTDNEGSRTRVGLTIDGWNEVVGTYPFHEKNLVDILTIREIELARDETSKDVIGWAEQHRIEIEERYEITESIDQQSPGEKIRQRLSKNST